MYMTQLVCFFFFLNDSDEKNSSSNKWNMFSWKKSENMSENYSGELAPEKEKNTTSMTDRTSIFISDVLKT